jgi:uncharacterized protein YutE (UPF0331/DUF86 family)
MNLNADLLRARCAEIEESVRRLERFLEMDRADFLADQDSLDIASHRLLIAIEAAFALCYHVTARRLQKTPEEYAECFAALRDGELIDADLAHRLQAMARFRNVLVHVYWRIDYGRLHEIICSDLGDLRAFAAAMIRLL